MHDRHDRCGSSRGHRFTARVGQTLVYHTDSLVGMRDQCVRLLEWKYRTDEIEVFDELRSVIVRSVDAGSVSGWRV